MNYISGCHAVSFQKIRVAGEGCAAGVPRARRRGAGPSAEAATARRPSTACARKSKNCARCSGWCARKSGGAFIARRAKALREAADSLTAPRDARVMLKVFGKLAGRDARKFAGIEKALRKNCRRESRRFRKKDSAAAADRILRKTSRRVGELKIKAGGWAAIEPGLKESYRRGREACRLARPAAVAGKFSRLAEARQRPLALFLSALSGLAGGSARLHGRAGAAGRTTGRRPRPFPVATIRGGALRRSGRGSGGIEAAD